MASDILRSSNSIPWAPRTGSSRTASPSSSCVSARGTPEQRESPSRQSSQMYTSPPERRLVEASPSPLVPSSDETENSPSATSSLQAESTQERRSAPPVLGCDSENPIRPDPPPQPSFSCSHKGWLETAQVSQHYDFPSTLRAGLGKNPGGRAGAKSKGGGVDDSGNPGLRLQTVTEGSGIEGGAQPASTVIPSVAMHGQLEAQPREESWGGTFRIKWLCTERLPFHRTRHLRNPWNHGREIKVSRDGTELEPAVGQQLVEEWMTLASKTTDADDAGRTAGLASRRVAKSLATPGPPGESKGAKEEPS